ncbi:two-component system response regulato [Desulfonema ishimotonii]|uniref:Two-component system response regulato n=1 Tax=Desulfonema ishimotonii TaxID=45657 RepID=A0A401FU86_9BACT|nr:diguanylate cyclase [Desulfonema ishimotonii]GBC60547.1 two-component system response regulato [Desulfonema ishimotonii]
MTPRTAFVVENDFILSLALCTRLERLGFRVAGTSDSARTALEILASQRPDVVILDLKHPEPDTDIEIARHLFTQYQLPVLLITTPAPGEPAHPGLCGTPFASLRTPFDEADLGEAIALAFYKAGLSSRLRESESRLTILADFSHDWEFWRKPDGTFAWLSPSSERITGYSPRSLADEPDLFSRMAHPEDREILHTSFDSLSPDVRHLEYRIITPAGECRWLALSCTPVFSEDGISLGWRCSGREITDRKQAEEDLKRLAFYDRLTGLPNRHLLRDHLQMALTRCRRHEHLLGLIHISIRHFATVNRQFGSEVGNRALVSVAEQLTASLRESDLVARMGGDEFAVILSRIRDKQEAETVAETLMAQLTREMDIGGHTVRLTPRMGISLYPFDGPDGDTLLSRAEKAAVRAGQDGPDVCRFCSFDPETPSSALPRPEKEAEAACRIFHDSLTGLANRFLFSERLILACRYAHRHGQAVGLLCIDFDNFRHLRDLCISDRSRRVRILAVRLKNSVRESDTVARIGETRFTAVLQDIRHKKDADAAARKILSALTHPVNMNNQRLAITVSIGISVYPFDGTVPRDLTGKALEAMQQARKRGGTICHFCPPGYRGEIKTERVI